MGAGNRYIRVGFKLLFSLLLLLALLKIADLWFGLRFFRSQLEEAANLRSIRLREIPPFTSYFIPAAKIPFRETGVWVRTDSNGFIRSPHGNHRNPQLTLVFLGGSTTRCAFVQEQLRFAGLVGKLLEDSLGIPVNSHNSSHQGNHTLHSVNALINKVLPLKPHIAVLMHNVNDLGVLVNKGSYWNNHPTRSLLLDSAMHRARWPGELNPVFPNLQREIESPGLEPVREFLPGKREYTAAEEQEYIRQFDGALGTFISTCRAWDIQPVLMTQPVGEIDYPELHEAFNQVIRDVCRRDSVELVDLQQAFAGKEKQYIYDDIHITDSGSMYTAAIISRHLVRMTD